jgi:hypothetical protein
MGGVVPQVDEEHQRMQPQDQQSTHRHSGEDRVDRGPPVFLPVDVGQVQDQRVLVQHQRGSDAEDDCPRGEFGFVPIDGQRHQRDAGHHHHEDPDHHMVDVLGPDVDIPRLPPPGRPAAAGPATDQTHERARHEEGENEGDQTAQQWQSAAADDIVFEPVQHAKKLRPLRVDGCPRHRPGRAHR